MTKFKMHGNPAIVPNALENIDNLLSDDEIRESDLEVQIISALVEARRDQGLTQKDLEELSDVKQPVISRVEKGYANPKVSTLLKILKPLNKTLYIGSVDNNSTLQKN